MIIIKKKIDEENVQKYKNLIDNLKEKYPNINISIGKSIRKFISRYICGKRLDNEFHKDTILFQLLEERSDLWDKNFFESNDFKNIIENLKNNIKIIQDYCYEFYLLMDCKEKLEVRKELLEEKIYSVANTVNNESEEEENYEKYI